MGFSINLGSISTSFVLDASAFVAGVEEAVGVLDLFRVNMGQQFAQHEEAHRQHLGRLHSDAQKGAEALQEVYDHIYDLTHSETQIETRDAVRQYQDRLRSNRSSQMAEEAEEELRLEMERIQGGANQRKADAAFSDDLALIKAIGEARKSDAEAVARIEEQIEAAFRDDLALVARIGEVARQDAAAIAAMKKADEQEQRDRDRWESQVAATDRAWVAEQKHSPVTDFEMEAANSDQRAKEAQARSLPERAPDIRTAAGDMEKQLDAILEQMKQGMENILGGTLTSIFEGHSKQVFDKMLQNFVHMLEEMAAKAIAAGIVNLIFGGSGGFLGGFLGAFGFDDANNDEKATNWGYDFAGKFLGGMEDYQTRQRGGMGDSGGSGGPSRGDGQPVAVHVHIGEVHNHTPADVGAMSEEIAWKVQQGLSGRFVGGNR